MGSGLSTDHDQLDHWKVYACRMPLIPANDHKNGTLSYILHVTVIKQNSYRSALLQGCNMVVAWHPKPKTITFHSKVKAMPSERKTMATVQLLSMVIYSRVYSRPFVATGLRCCAKTSPFCTILSGLILPTRLRLVMMVCLKGYRPPSLKSHSHARRFPSLSTP
jgi:hypothetical protein